MAEISIQFFIARRLPDGIKLFRKVGFTLYDIYLRLYALSNKSFEPSKVNLYKFGRGVDKNLQIVIILCTKQIIDNSTLQDLNTQNIGTRYWKSLIPSTKDGLVVEKDF